MTKKNNHLLPRMVIKRWEEVGGKIFNKEFDEIRDVNLLDYSKEYYYSLGKKDDELENRISLIETYIGMILKRLKESNGKIILSEKDMEILKLYVVLQSCRNENTSPFIKQDYSGYYQNNNYIFGVPLVSTQEDAVVLTQKICKEFERIKKLGPEAKYNYDFTFMNVYGINSYLCWGQHLVIVSSENNDFIVSETTAVIECTMDGDYLFTFVPVSPKIGLMLVKSKYLYSQEYIEKTKKRFGIKYGNLLPDPYLSECIDDKKLIFSGITNEGNVEIKIQELSDDEIYMLNSVIYEDGKNILYANEDALNNAKKSNEARIIYG